MHRLVGLLTSTRPHSSVHGRPVLGAGRDCHIGLAAFGKQPSRLGARVQSAAASGRTAGNIGQYARQALVGPVEIAANRMCRWLRRPSAGADTTAF